MTPRALSLALIVVAGFARPGIAQSSTQQPSRIPGTITPINLDCSKLDGVRRVLCQYSEALLNRNCESIQDSNQKLKCRAWLKGASEFEEYYRLTRMCGADWFPIVAKECASRAARLSPQFKEKLVADLKAKVAWREAQVLIWRLRATL
jgi:hypothetical protein